MTSWTPEEPPTSTGKPSSRRLLGICIPSAQWRGQECPRCRGTDLEWDSIDQAAMTQPGMCLNEACGMNWVAELDTMSDEYCSECGEDDWKDRITSGTTLIVTCWNCRGETYIEYSIVGYEES